MSLRRYPILVLIFFSFHGEGIKNYLDRLRFSGSRFFLFSPFPSLRHRFLSGSARVVPGYSGGTAADFHGLPFLSPLRGAHQFEIVIF